MNDAPTIGLSVNGNSAHRRFEDSSALPQPPGERRRAERAHCHDPAHALPPSPLDQFGPARTPTAATALSFESTPSVSAAVTAISRGNSGVRIAQVDEQGCQRAGRGEQIRTADDVGDRFGGER